MIQKGKVSLYSSQNYIQLQSVVSSITSGRYTVQVVPSKKKKKKSLKRERGKENEMDKGERNERGGKEEKKEKKDGKSLCGRKGKRENEMWKKRRKEGKENEREEEGEERRGRERRIENRESGTRSASPSPDAFPSAKLGNNITSIKGKQLGKNTTPTSKGPTKLNQSLQANPPQRRSSLEASSRADLIYTPGKAESPKYGLHGNRTAIYKKAKAHGNLRSGLQFSMNQH